MQGGDTDRIKMDARSWRVTCLDCGREFEATRSDATFCSAKCRKHNHRAPVRKQNAITDLVSLGRMAQLIAEEYRHSTEVYEAMQTLEKMVKSAVGMFETNN